MDRQLVGLRAVALEEAGLRGRDIHDVQIRSVGQQFDVVVRARGCRGHEPVPHAGGPDALVQRLAVAGEQPHELPEGLRTAKAAQAGGLVQAGRREVARVNLAVPDGLVVRQVDASRVAFLDGPDEPRRLFPSEVLDGIAPELLPHAERNHDQANAVGVLRGEPHGLQLRDCLLQPEGGEQCAPAAGEQPGHDGAGVWWQARIHVPKVDLEAGGWRRRNLATEEVEVWVGHNNRPCTGSAGLARHRATMARTCSHIAQRMWPRRRKTRAWLISTRAW